jgi:hypothetical protein
LVLLVENGLGWANEYQGYRAPQSHCSICQSKMLERCLYFLRLVVKWLLLYFPCLSVAEAKNGLGINPMVDGRTQKQANCTHVSRLMDSAVGFNVASAHVLASKVTVQYLAGAHSSLKPSKFWTANTSLSLNSLAGSHSSLKPWKFWTANTSLSLNSSNDSYGGTSRRLKLRSKIQT